MLFMHDLMFFIPKSYKKAFSYMEDIGTLCHYTFT